jgi:general secretion pathway protein D
MPSRPIDRLVDAHYFLRLAKKCYSGLAISVCVIALAGCAAQSAYRDGKDLVAQGKIEEGLLKLQQAATDEPRNVEYRLTLAQTREHALTNFLEQADRLASAGKNADAGKLYQRVLTIDADNDRARAALRSLDASNRHEQLLREANAAWAKNEADNAQLKLRAILAENPDHPVALALRRTITEKTSSPPVESLLAATYTKPITIEFKDVALKQVFEVISRSSGLNFLFDKEVKTDQKTSIFLKNATIESAVDYMLLTNQLEEQVLDANTILIYPNSPAKQKDYQKMVIKSFFLTNVDAKAIAEMLKTMVKSQNVFIDERLNVLMVRDNPEAIRLAEKLIGLLDAPEPEVMLEVEILEVKRSRLLDLGVQWPGSLTLTPLPSTTGGTLTLRDLLNNTKSSTLGVGVSPVTINANTQDSGANILANPRIRTRNHEKAKILIGDRVPNITTTANATGFVSDSINYIDVGLKLEVEPTIYLDNDVAIKVSLEVSNIVSQLQSKNGSSAYQIGTRNASTVLRLKDGENQVLAGLIDDEDRKSASKIPGLGDLPMLGRLFGSTSDDNQKTELVLSITPHLIRNIQRPDATLAELDAGTENNLHIHTNSGARGASPTAPIPQLFVADQHTGLVRSNAPIPGNAAPRAAAVADMTSTASASKDAGAADVIYSSVPTTGMPSNPAPVGNIASSPATPNASPDATSIIVATSGAQLHWQGPAMAKVGDTVTLQLAMQSDKPITSVPMAIGFDKRILQVTDVAEGNFLKRDGAQTKFTKRIDPNGQILMTAIRISDGGATLPDNLVAITFRTLAPADASAIQLLTMTPVGLNGIAVSAPLPPPQTIRVQP